MPAEPMEQREKEADTQSRSGRWLMGSLIGLAVVAAAYVAWWFAAAASLEKGVGDWITDRRNDGWSVEHGGLAVDGFPFHLNATVDKPNIAGPPGRGWNWRGERLFFTARPWTPHRVRFDLSGRHSGRMPLRTRAQAFELTAPVLTGGLVFRRGRAQSVSIETEGFGLTFDGGGAGSVDIAEGEAHLSPAADAATGFHLRLRDLTVAETLRAPLGERVRNLLVKGRVTGPIEPAAWPDPVVHWREAGGTVEVENLDIDYEPLRLTGDGTLALDEGLQPMGAFSVRARGFFAAIDELVARGFMDKRDALGSKLVLGVLSKKPENGGDSYLDLALTLQERALYAGPLKIMRFPIIIW